LQQGTLFADIAILPPTADAWRRYSAHNEPFHAVMYPEWQTLIWESIHQNGSACDYLSERVIQDATVQNENLLYGPRRYHTIFLPQVETLDPTTARKLAEFVESGGRVFFIETYPSKACGWNDHESKDKEVRDNVDKMRRYTDRCIFLDKPAGDYASWYKTIQEQYHIQPYVQVDSPDKFITQARYQTKDEEIFLFVNSNMSASYEIRLRFAREITRGKQAWLWDAETGERCKLPVIVDTIDLDMGPADLKLLVFDKQKKGSAYEPAKSGDANAIVVMNQWSVTGQHVDGSTIKKELDKLQDLKDLNEWASFCGNIVYKTNLVLDEQNKIEWLNLGKVFGVSELFVNGETVGVKWYGRRIYSVGKYIKPGKNSVEIRIPTTMGNYMKSLKDNPVAQYWTNEGRTIQSFQSIVGM
jgi:hypothetical protein